MLRPWYKRDLRSINESQESPQAVASRRDDTDYGDRAVCWTQARSARPARHGKGQSGSCHGNSHGVELDQETARQSDRQAEGHRKLDARIRLSGFGHLRSDSVKARRTNRIALRQSVPSTVET